MFRHGRNTEMVVKADPKPQVGLGGSGFSVATGAIKWLIDHVATLAYETFLEAFVSAARASAMNSGFIEWLVWISDILSDRLVVGVLLGFTLLGLGSGLIIRI